MTESPASTETTKQRVRKRRKSNRFRSAVRRIWRDWWVEILVVALILLAIFLLIDVYIRQTFFAWSMRLLAGLERLVSSSVQSLTRFVRGTTLSDLVAYVLLLIVVGLVVWRIRWRLMTSSRFTEVKCPTCGSDLHRIHRHGGDRVVNLFVPVRRYECRNRDCRWRGLRVQTSRHG